MGFSGIQDVLVGLAALVGLGDKPWGVAAIGAAVFVVLLPVILKNQHTSRARRLLQRAWASTRPAERDELEAEALREVQANATGLVVVADLALDKGRLALAQAAYDALRATGKQPYERRRIELALAREKRQHNTLQA